MFTFNWKKKTNRIEDKYIKVSDIMKKIKQHEPTDRSIVPNLSS